VRPEGVERAFHSGRAAAALLDAAGHERSRDGEGPWPCASAPIRGPSVLASMLREVAWTSTARGPWWPRSVSSDPPVRLVDDEGAVWRSWRRRWSCRESNPGPAAPTMKALRA